MDDEAYRQTQTPTDDVLTPLARILVIVFVLVNHCHRRVSIRPNARQEGWVSNAPHYRTWYQQSLDDSLADGGAWGASATHPVL